MPTDLLVFNGRMGRARYLRLTLMSLVLAGSGLIMLAFPWWMSSQHGIELMPLGVSSFFALGLLILGLWIALASSIRRLHDIGWSALWLVFCAVPVEVIALPAALVLSLAMSFLRGTRGANVHGPDPAAT